MKRVIFTEGVNDTIFLKEILKKSAPVEESSILYYNQDAECEMKNLKFAEEHYFGKLESYWLPFRLLVKSEGGKKKIITLIISKLVYFCEKGYNPIILIDLDGGEIRDFITEMKGKIEAKFKNIDLVVESKELMKKEDALLHSIKMIKNKTKGIGTIYVIGFNESLENVTGIKKSHSESEKRLLSETYIEKSGIKDIFIKAFESESKRCA